MSGWAFQPILPATQQLSGAAPTTGYIKVWDGSTWVKKPIKVWNGTAWVIKPLKRWNGTAWVQTT